MRISRRVNTQIADKVIDMYDPRWSIVTSSLFYSVVARRYRMDWGYL